MSDFSRPAPRRWLFGLAWLILALLLILLMAQNDRQWQRLLRLQQTLAEQAEDIRHTRSALANLSQQIQQGAPAHTAAAPPTTTTRAAPPVQDAFEHARAAAAQPDYSRGGVFLQAFGTGIKTLTPLISTDAYASDVQSRVLESLLIRDPDTLEWRGLLAEDWQVSEDGLVLTFRLRADAFFSDGEPVQADDVAFSFAFIMNEAIAAPRLRAYYQRIESVRALDTRRVQFTFKEPYFNALSLAGGMEILAQHFYQPWLEQPRQFNESRGLLFGSGPYRLADPHNWRPDQGGVELERNPRYWGPVAGSYERISWRVIENESARLTAFRNGELDSYSARAQEYKQLLADAQIKQKSQHFNYMSATAGYSWIGWNQSRGGQPTRFADVRVRRAMTYLTDTARLIEEVFLGYAEAAVSPFSGASPQHDSALQAPPFDPERARALLAEAGYEDRNHDGVLEDADGKAFEFELMFFQSNADTRRIVLFLRDLYARAGVLLKPVPSEWSVMLEKMKQRDFDAITLGWTSSIEVDIYQIFHSSQIADGGDNFIAYRNAELDKIMDAARGEINEARRMQYWHAAERILVAEQPYTFLTRQQSLLFVNQRIANVRQNRFGMNLATVPVETWLVSESQLQ